MAGTDDHARAGFLHRLTGGVTERVVGVIDPDLVLDQVDVDALIGRIDADALLARIDINAMLDRIDPNALLARVEPDLLMDRVDVDALLARVDVDALLDRIDPNALLARVDVGALLARIEPDELMSRVDVDALLARVDVNAMLARVDVNAMLAEVDVDAMLADVDLEALVRRSGVPELVAESTNQLAGSALDLARRQLVAVDVVIGRALDRVLRRDPDTEPVGPPLLAAGPATADDRPRRGAPRQSVSGHYAGPVSRVAAALLDVAIVTTSFTVAVAGLDYLAGVFLGVHIKDWTDGSPVALATLLLWAWAYSFGSHAVAGRTLAKGVVGLRVVAADGSPLSVRQAFRRTLAFPLSGLLLGLGFLMVLVQREHRALHDLIGGTAEVYDWGERAAEMPGPLSSFLARQHGVEVGQPDV